MLEITMNKGFWLTFENGVTCSVQFGPGNYCENNGVNDTIDGMYLPDGKYYFSSKPSKNAEVAAWVGDKEHWITRAYKEQEDNEWADDVIGYLSADEVADFIWWCKNVTVKKKLLGGVKIERKTK